MKSIYIVMAIFTTLTIIGMVSVSTQQVFAPRDCGGCSAFKKLTNQFEKDVLNAALGSPEEIPGLLDQYNRDVLELFPSTSPS